MPAGTPSKRLTQIWQLANTMLFCYRIDWEIYLKTVADLKTDPNWGKEHEAIVTTTDKPG